MAISLSGFSYRDGSGAVLQAICGLNRSGARGKTPVCTARRASVSACATAYPASVPMKRTASPLRVWAGRNIAAILDRAVWTRDGKHTLLLQPMSRAEVLRRFLSEHGYKIQWEALARERGILYPVMEVTAGHETLSVGQWYGGAKLSRDPLGDRYLIETILRLQNAVAGLNRAVGADNQRRADELRDILTELLSMREEWRHANSGQSADNSTGSADRRGN